MCRHDNLEDSSTAPSGRGRNRFGVLLFAVWRFLCLCSYRQVQLHSVKRRFENGFRVSYSKTEITDSIEKIKQPIVREALRLLDVKDYLEIVSVADVPGRSGLGGSSSYAVGVLNALHFFKRENVPRQALAEEACRIEIDVLKEPIGKQDQYVASFGGINSYEIERDGTVSVRPLVISPHGTAELENNLLLFYTGIKRDASRYSGARNKIRRKATGESLRLCMRSRESATKSEILWRTETYEASVSSSTSIGARRRTCQSKSAIAVLTSCMNWRCGTEPWEARSWAREAEAFSRSTREWQGKTAERHVEGGTEGSQVQIRS